ncbi:hypothetical protein Bpro_0332 [Polaromonas sp. JS666]|nr:hypothetical protein Bpro_0332 [Polaromonas sp. JS666]
MGNPLQALQASLHPPAFAQPARPRLLVAGVAGVLGSEVLRRLVGSGRFAHTEVLVSEPMATGLPAVGIALAAPLPIEQWPARPQPVHTGLVMFEPPRLYNGRERTLWTPAPEQLPALARWLKRCGVQTLVIVVPHASGRLPDALKRGLANLDEQAVVALGFERVLLVRSARKAEAPAVSGLLEKTAGWMLSTLKYMVPASEQPVRPAKLAEFVDAALRVLPPGTHVAAPELLWQAGQSTTTGQSAGQARSMQGVVQAWLAAGHNPKKNSAPDSTPALHRPSPD